MEIQNILSLNHLKAVGPNSIPTKILKFHSNGISNQSSELIHLSFSLSVFPSILKCSKVFQKESYLNVQIMVQYLYFLVLTNSLKMMYNSLYEFLEPKSLIYNLQSGFRQKHWASHVLIHRTNKIREQLDKRNFGCGTFVDFLNPLIQLILIYLLDGITMNWITIVQLS